MTPFRNTLFASVASIALLGACTEESTSPLATPPSLPTVLTTVVNCFGGPSGIQCGSDDGAAAAAPDFARVLGGQNTYVTLAATSNVFDAVTLRLSSSVTVQNLTDQPLGTSDGTTLDPDGVRVFFHTPPTNGVTLVNADGIASFTGSSQAFLKYPEVISANSMNDTAKTWIFQLPSSATTFTFQVYVTGKQPNEASPITIQPHSFITLASGSLSTHRCATRTGGVSYCWGDNTSGQIGDNTVTQGKAVPTGLVGSVTLRVLSAGAGFSCGLDTNGMAYCWGGNSFGRLGNGTMTTGSRIPASVTMPAAGGFSSISAGRNHTCALTSIGNAYCWGQNDFGQIGDGTSGTANNRAVPTAVGMPAGVTFSMIATGGSHTCALSNAAKIYCWGYNNWGELGHVRAGTAIVPTPTAVTSSATFTTLTASDSFSCGLTTSGAAYCWGANFVGQLGDGTLTSSFVPVAVTMPAGVTFTSLAGGNGHSCAIGSNASTFCWGSNVQGQVGDNSTTHRNTPTVVAAPPGITFRSLALGGGFTCGLEPAGMAYCWGANSTGQLGSGTMGGSSLTPIAVRMP